MCSTKGTCTWHQICQTIVNPKPLGATSSVTLSRAAKPPPRRKHTVPPPLRDSATRLTQSVDAAAGSVSLQYSSRCTKGTRVDVLGVSPFLAVALFAGRWNETKNRGRVCVHLPKTLAQHAKVCSQRNLSHASRIALLLPCVHALHATNPWQRTVRNRRSEPPPARTGSIHVYARWWHQQQQKPRHWSRPTEIPPKVSVVLHMGLA